MNLGCKHLHRSLLAIAVALVAGSSAQATVYDYNYNYVAGQASYSAPAGSTINVPLYLDETSTPSGSSLLDNEGGLGQAGLTVAPISGSSSLSSILANLSLIDDGSGFHSASYNAPNAPPAGSLSLQENIDSLFAPENGFSTGVGEVAGRVYLGYVTVQVGNTIGETSNFEVSEYDPNSTENPNTFTNLNGYNLDATGTDIGGDNINKAAANGFSVTATAAPVPEPATVALFAVGGLGLVARRRRAALA